jgi:predicted metalloprotease with PDZ domain
LTSKGAINLVIARRKSLEPSAIKKVDEEQKAKEITLDPSQTPDFGQVKKDEIRRVILNEALGLDFNSYLPDDQTQMQVHFISNVQPSSIAERAGLHDGDRILTINGLNTKNFQHEDVRRMLLSKKPIELTVVNEPKYIELIESVQHNQKRMSTSLPADPSVEEQDQKSDVPRDLPKYLNRLFTDDRGTVYYKHCLLKKEPSFDSYGFLLRFSNRLHVIDAVETEFPAYTCGLREGDVILFVDRQNIEQLSHDEVKKRIRHQMKAGEEVDLVIMARDDVQRYRDYQEHNSIDWKTLFAKDSESETNGFSGK